MYSFESLMFLQVFSFATLIVCAVHGGLVGQQPRFRGNDAKDRAESDQDESQPESTGVQFNRHFGRP